MTPNPTPTRTYVSERRRPLPRACALFGHGSYALPAVSGRKESGSKTAGCRFDSCPTCQQKPRNEAAPSNVAWSRFHVFSSRGSKNGSNAGERSPSRSPHQPEAHLCCVVFLPFLGQRAPAFRHRVNAPLLTGSV